MWASMSTWPSPSSMATAVTSPSAPNLTRESRFSTVASFADMARSFHYPTVGGEAFQAHGAARMQLVRADAHPRAQPVLGTVREAGGGVHHQGGAVHARQEGLLNLGRFRKHGVRMAGAVLVDVVHGLVPPVHHLDRKLEIQVFLVPVRLHGGLDARMQVADELIPP